MSKYLADPQYNATIQRTIALVLDRLCIYDRVQGRTFATRPIDQIVDEVSVELRKVHGIDNAYSLLKAGFTGRRKDQNGKIEIWRDGKLIGYQG